MQATDDSDGALDEGPAAALRDSSCPSDWSWLGAAVTCGGGRHGIGSD
jgi:hypothetical protein